MFDGGKLWQISHRKLLVSKTLVVNSCLFPFYIVHTIIKFGESPVIRQTHQRFPLTLYGTDLVCNKYILILECGEYVWYDTICYR